MLFAGIVMFRFVSDHLGTNLYQMMDWELFKKYMGLPDRNKGNKLHIRELWGKYDKTKVSESAVPSLKHMNDYFDTKEGKEYLLQGLENLTNAELISQIAKNNPVWSDEKSRELLRLNRKFTYYRNVNNLMQTIYRQNKIHTLNSDDYAVEISNKFNKMMNIILDFCSFLYLLFCQYS